MGKYEDLISRWHERTGASERKGGVHSPVSEIDHGDPVPAANDHPMEGNTPHGSTPANRNLIVTSTPHGSDTPMDAWNPHEHPATGDAMQARGTHAIEPIELTREAVRDLFPRLETALQLEAFALLERLQDDRNFAKAFRADFYDAYAVLDMQDRVACLWALIYHPADIRARWKAMLRAA